METSSIIGAGILGGLHYNESQHSWAIELGQWLGSLIVAFTRERLEDMDIVSARQDILKATDRILSNHSIPLAMQAVLASNDNNAVKAAYELQNVVQSLKGIEVSALVLIGQCALGLRSDSDPTNAENLIRAHIGDIDRRCSELGIATDAFGKILLQQHANDLSATGVSRLLEKLSKPLSVLIMSADPRDANRLRLAEERRELEDAIERTRFRGSLDLHDVVSCRVRDITTALDRYTPNILHFSGHGDNSALFFENDKGEAISVEKAALAGLLGTQRNLKLVILNACYSKDQAQAIADAVGHVVGMEGSVLDEDSIAFSSEFYKALGHGRTFEEAFERARLAMGLTTTLKLHLLKRKV